MFKFKTLLVIKKERKKFNFEDLNIIYKVLEKMFAKKYSKYCLFFKRLIKFGKTFSKI